METRFRFLVHFGLAVFTAKAGNFEAAAAEPSAPSSAAVPAPPQPPPPGTLIFVPYDRATGPRLEKDQSVLLPYAEFLRLKGTAAGQPESPEFQPTASLAQSNYKGSLTGGVAKLDAEFVLEALARPSDSLEIQLPFAEASIESASVEGEQATLAPLLEHPGLRVLLRGGGRRTIRLRLATAISSQGAERRIQFHFPRAAASILSLEIGEEVVVGANPDLIPVTVVRNEKGGSVIQVSCGSLDHVTFGIRPRNEMTGGAAQARLEVAQEIAATISAASASLRVGMNVAVLAGRVSSVRVQLPPGMKLLSVSGSFVKDWSQPGEDRMTAITLVREVSEPFTLTLDAQSDSAAAEQLVLSDFHVPEAVRESGKIVTTPDEFLSVWPEETVGLESVSVTGGANLASHGYRFAQPGWKLALSRRRVPARVRADGILLYEITDDMIRLKTRHYLFVTGGGIFGASFEVPEGYELREAGPPELVAGFRPQGRTVEVNFRGEQRSNLFVDMRLEKARTPSDSLAALDPVRVKETEEDAGYVVLAAPLALRITETESRGLTAMDVRTLQARLQPLLSADIHPMLGYRYFNTAAFGVKATIEKQKTRLTCQTDLLGSISPSLLNMRATLNYNVEFSATDTFQFLVPSSAGEEVNLDGIGIKDKKRTPPPADASLTTWTIHLQSPVLGPYAIGVSFDQPITGTDSGKPVDLTIPRIRAAAVARETGHVAISRGENLEVSVTQSDGLEPRDTKELPASLAGAFLGFRYFDPDHVALKLRLVRHELESVLGALIRRTHIETVMSDQREATHEVIFEVQNNREQYLELRLPEGMKIWSAFVRGKPVRPTLREKDKANLIELTKSETKDAAFRVRLILRETLPGGELGYWGKLHFVPPQPLNIPVLRTTWKLYLPPRWRYLKFSGGMRLADRPGLPWIEPAAELLLNDLPADVAGGIAKPALRPQQAVVSTQYQNEETEEEKRARLQGAALEIPIVREGLQYEFNKLSGVGDIEIKYWKSKALVILQGCFALAILFALLWSMAARRRLRPAVTMSAATFILASLTDGLAGRLSATALTASCAALAAAIIIVILRRTAESLRDRKSAVKEPLLHPAPVTPWFPPDLPISPDPAQPEVPSAANGDSAEDNPDDGPEDAKEDGGGEKPPRKKRKA